MKVWTFNIERGFLDKDGILVSKTCSGEITEGIWKISGPPFTCEAGEYCLRLEPMQRIKFPLLIHGGDKEHPGIVADRVTRERLYQSGDTELQVISGKDNHEAGS